MTLAQVYDYANCFETSKGTHGLELVRETLKALAERACSNCINLHHCEIYPAAKTWADLDTDHFTCNQWETKR